VPFTKPPDSDEIFAAPNRRHARNAHAPEHADSSLVEEGDGFTMVLPQTFSQRPDSSSGIPKSSTPRLSPQKGSLASPLNVNRLRSPAARSPERLRSPLPATVQTPDAEPVQVYEDPFTSDDTGIRAGAGAEEDDKPVLEELPIDRANERQPSEESQQALNQSTRSNEQNIDVQRTPRHHKTTSTGSVITTNGDNAEVLRSRRLLNSGIERIRAKTLDAHGFRRVQDIVKSGQDVWGDDGQKFGELLMVMLDYLEAPNEALKATGGTGSAATKAQSLKGQTLATIRAMLTLHRREAGPYYSRALCSVLVSRRQWDESMHITADIEKTADEIIKYCNPLDTLNTVLDLLDSLTNLPTSPASSSSSERMTSPTFASDPSSHRTASFALQTLGSLLSAARSRQLPVSAQLNQRLGACAVKYLQDPDSDVRKADLDFCLVMHEGDGEEFWRVLRGTGVKEGSVNLITYYIAKSRRGKVGA
jgi:CLIP-associating protein 1/2